MEAVPSNAALFARHIITSFKKNTNLDWPRSILVKGLNERARARACFRDGYEDWHCARDRIGSKRGLKSEL